MIHGPVRLVELINRSFPIFFLPPFTAPMFDWLWPDRQPNSGPDPFLGFLSPGRSCHSVAVSQHLRIRIRASFVSDKVVGGLKKKKDAGRNQRPPALKEDCF
ncbi:hypothetical protein IWQ54_003511 [Labrenzia sp. EL_195]|nr:hypothetical protein [Labrenzia sp. EL_195]